MRVFFILNFNSILKKWSPKILVFHFINFKFIKSLTYFNWPNGHSKKLSPSNLSTSLMDNDYVIYWKGADGIIFQKSEVV